MIKRLFYFLIMSSLPFQCIGSNTKGDGPLRYPWHYPSFAEYISEQFIRPQFNRIKEKDLPEIMKIAEEKAVERVPRLVDTGLGHLGDVLKPYGIGGLVIAGSLGAGLWLYNHLRNAGLAGLVKRFQKYDQSINTDAQILTEQLSRLKSLQSKKIDPNIFTLKDLLTGCRDKLNTMLNKIENAEVLKK